MRDTERCGRCRCRETREGRGPGWLRPASYLHWFAPLSPMARPAKEGGTVEGVAGVEGSSRTRRRYGREHGAAAWCLEGSMRERS
jgi:hypothetical protein